MPAEANREVKVYCRTCKSKLDMSDLEPFSKIPCPECGTQLRVPKRFERYLLEKLCGQGGMSSVYRAIDPQLARRVAVKILEVSEADMGVCRQTFLEEARTVSKLNHPGIIPVYNCGVWEDQPFMAMRFMENGSFETHLKAGTLPELPVVLSGLLNVAEGLAYALESGIVHHDIKPGNIMLTREWEAKLGDFDLANVHKEKKGFVPIKGGFGSPVYASPERLFFGAEDFRGDIFSLGVTIYELTAGQPPFETRGDPNVLLELRRQGRYQRLPEVCPGCPAVLADLVDRMLLSDIDQRPRYPEIIRLLRESVEAAVAGGQSGGEPRETQPLLFRLTKKFGLNK